MRLACIRLLAALAGAAQAPATTFGGRKAWVAQVARTTRVFTVLGHQQLTIQIHAWQIPVKAGPLAPHRPYPQCTYPQNPCSITDWIHITLGGHRLWVDQGQLAGRDPLCLCRWLPGPPGPVHHRRRWG